ncbi:MAG: hypothetical protein QG656_2123, partial [Candidatus Hydrogenedentes bacterium]|nr:hypothetical protein [Candidatus Hydrogenedentota bacterium]
MSERLPRLTARKIVRILEKRESIFIYRIS